MQGSPRAHDTPLDVESVQISGLSSYCTCSQTIFSSPGQSPGRAIVLPPASALASVLALAAAAVPALAKC